MTIDVPDPGEVEGMVGRVADGLGWLDVMVANTRIAQVAPLRSRLVEDPYVVDLVTSIGDVRERIAG